MLIIVIASRWQSSNCQDVHDRQGSSWSAYTVFLLGTSFVQVTLDDEIWYHANHDPEDPSISKSGGDVTMAATSLEVMTSGSNMDALQGC